MICRRCGGPCRAWAGNVHGWTCRACLQRYIDEQPNPTPKRIKQSGKLIHSEKSANHER